MRAEEERLFAPGTGAFAPVLAGRDREQRVLSLCLSDLRSGGSPPHDVVLIGPRGNGKTVLLRWFENACREASVNVVRVVPSRVGDHQALVEALLPAGRPEGCVANLGRVPVAFQSHRQQRCSCARGGGERESRAAGPCPATIDAADGV